MRVIDFEDSEVARQLYLWLVECKKDRRHTCQICGERYSFDNINMCKRCGDTYCGHCSGPPGRQLCGCSGEID